MAMIRLMNRSGLAGNKHITEGIQRIRLETGVRNLTDIVNFFKNKNKDYNELLK